jgi:ribosomal protein S18 acetylase RimI-like enzyme
VWQAHSVCAAQMSAPACDAAPAAGGTAEAAPLLRHVLRDASPADEAALAALYTAALEYNPAFDSVFERRRDDPAGHADALLWLFHRRVALLLSSKAHYLVAVDEHTGVLLGGAAILPRASKAGLWDMLRVGLLEWPFRFGLPSLLRGLARDTLPPDPPGAVPFEGLVSTVAVSPEAQGRGVGSALLRALLARWDAAGGGALALDTQRERNVPFYERQGFRVTHTLTNVGAHGVEYTDWKMRREAAQPAAVPSA